MNINSISTKAKKAFNLLKIKLQQKQYQGLPYLYKKNDSDSLLIVFAAFTGEKRRFNYVRSFKNLHCDQLFLLDPWGHLGSYNLYENGMDYPRRITEGLINKIIEKGNYKHLYAAGSSKGGTESIYFGLTIGADHIFSGACQYNLGTYLWREEFREIFYGMMGENAGENEVGLLNDTVRGKLRECSGCKSVVHVFYSKKELTYERQIIDLLCDLREFQIPYKDVESDFEKHEDVACPFADYVNEQFDIIKKQTR